MKQQKHNIQEQQAIQLKPIVSYPREAKVGERYLFTIDVQLAEDSPWPYQEEEFEISFILETAPFFTHEPVEEHEPGIVLHRYGGTYGAAEYLLTASQKAVAPGKIKVTLLNGWGLSIAQLELECEVKKDAQSGAKWTTRTTNQEQQAARSPEHLEIEQREDAVLDDHQQQELIAKQLVMVGWNVQHVDMLPKMGPDAMLMVPRGFIALHGYPSVEDDYLLIIDQEIVGFIRVYREEEQLPGEIESIDLSDLIIKKSNIKMLDSVIISPQSRKDIILIYCTTGYTTTFRNCLEPSVFLRSVYTFHQPSVLATWLDKAQRNPNDLFRNRLLHLLPLGPGDLFDYQYEAIQRIEQSLAEGYSRTLIQLETGRGKTHTATRSVYRLLEHANAQRIFYVVDIALAKQYAFEAFRNYIIDKSPLFEETSFTDRYGVEIVSNEKLDPSVHVYIGTLDDLYTLYASGGEGEHLPPPIRNNTSIKTTTSVKDYCADLPIEYFDVIFLAESEHIDYQFWRPVLDYFDTFYIGIVSSVSDEVLRFFNTHLVYPLVEATEEAQDKHNSKSLLSRQEIVTLMQSMRDLLKRDSGLSSEIDRLLQLTWLLLLKYLDDFELAQEKLMGDNYVPLIEEKYRWHDWVVADTSEQRRKDEELLKFVNSDLIPYLGRLSGENPHDIRSIISVIFRSTYNRIRSGYILREAVDKLNTINFNSSDDTRMIALYYETMLKEMRDSAGDAGDFYTPRPIVRFIIDCLNPQLGESLLDPACGTGGFLIETYERLAGRVRTPEQRQQLQDYLIGIEKDSTAYLLAAVNMLLHGIEVPAIIQSNAFITNIQQLYGEDYVDIIAVTPPFGGIEELSIVSNFPQDIGTNETTLLFVQYIMQTLKRPGGRCGIVLPNSFLFSNGVTSRIKHRLLTNFNLHTIVRLPSGVFAPYTNIPTNILFFEASEYLNSTSRESLTQEVWYYEIPLPEGRNSYTRGNSIQYEAFHDCILWWEHREENNHAWKVPVEKLFANNCNLDVKNPRST